VRGPGEVVQQDRPSDVDLVTESLRVGPLVREGGVVADVLARVRLAGVQEVEGNVGVAVSDLVQQRTLC